MCIRDRYKTRDQRVAWHQYATVRYDDKIVMSAAANTVDDVVSHQAYKKYSFITTNEDVERTRTFVSLHEHWRQLTKRVTSSKLSLRVSSSKNGGLDHYKEYAWSDPDC